MRRSLENVRKQRSPRTGNNNGESQMANIEQVNIKFNEDIDRQITGNLPNGYIHQLGTPGNILLSTGIPNLPIELSARQLKEKAETAHHPFNIEDIKNLPLMLQNPIGVFLYGDKEKAQNIIIEVQKDGKNFIVGLSLNFQHDGLIVNSIRGLYPKDLHEWLTWIQDGKSLYLNKEKIQNLINQQRRNLADVEYINLDSINNIIESFKNPSLETEKNQKNIRKSIAPVIEIEQFENSDPLDNEYYQAMVNLRDQNLADTLNARVFENMKESYPFTDDFPDWAEMSEDERIEQIHYYFDGMIELEEADLLSESQSEARSEQGHNEYSALNEAAEITRDYAEELGYDVGRININNNGTSFYITVDYEDSDDAWTLRISDHPQPPGGSYRERSWGGGRDKADVEAVIQNDKIDLAPIWQFLEEHAPDNGNVRFSISPQVDTPEFKNWFKDSKVVDENGKPLVVYHGSGTTFWEFKTEFTGLGNDQYGSGFYFTTNKETADIYTEKQLNGQTKIGGQDSPNVIQAYLSIQNPIVIELNSDDMRPENLSRIEVTTKQAYEIIKRAPDIMDEENSPLGDFFEEYWENGPSDSMIRKAARYTDVWDLLSLQGDWFGGDNGATAFREAVHEVLGYDGVQVNFKNGEKHYVAWFPNQIKSATDNVGTFDPDNPDIRFSISPVWTGSAADYDKPSLHAVGTGEGQQVYGWGLYGSESREIAEWYAQKDKDRKKIPYLKNKNGQIIRDSRGNAYESFLYDALRELYSSKQNVNKISLRNLLEKKLEGPHIFWYESIEKTYKQILDTLDDWDIIFPENTQNNLYKQTFWANKQEDLIEWTEGITEEQKNKILSQIQKENLLIDKQKESWEIKNLEYIVNRINNNLILHGNILYDNLRKYFGEAKKASEFLYRAGIDGITYIGNSSGVRNYIAFSDEDIRIDEHIRFSVSDGDGFVSTADREKMITVLMGIPQQQLDNMDGAAALDYLTQKQFKVPSDDMAQSLLNNARQRRFYFSACR